MATKNLTFRIGADNSELKQKFEEIKKLAGNTGVSIGAMGKVPVSTANLRGIMVEMTQLRMLATGLRVGLLNAVPDSQQARSYAQGLHMVEERMRHLQTLSSEVKTSMTGWGNRVTALGAGLTLAASVPLTIGANAMKDAGLQMDKLTRGLGSVSADADEAKTRLKELEQIARLPGLGVPEAIASYVQLTAAGISADRAKKSIMEFGNALATAGRGKEDLQAVVWNLTQIASMGKITGDEIRETAARVPQLRKAMQGAFGTADTERLKEMGITAEQFIDGVTNELAKLPRVTGGVANDFENMGDAVNRALAAGFKSVEPEVSAVTRLISDLTDGFAQWNPVAQKTVVTLGALVWAGGPVLTFLGQIANLTAAARLRMIGLTAAKMQGVMQERLAAAAIAENTRQTLANSAAMEADAAAIAQRNAALALTPAAAAKSAVSSAAGAAASVGSGAAAGVSAGVAAGARGGLLARSGAALLAGGRFLMSPQALIAAGIIADGYLAYKGLAPEWAPGSFANERRGYREKDKRATEVMTAYIADSKARQEMGQYGELREKAMGVEATKTYYRNAKDEEAAAKRNASTRATELETFIQRARETGQWAKVLQGELSKIALARDEALRTAEGPKEREGIVREYGAKAMVVQQQVLRDMAAWKRQWEAAEFSAVAEASAEQLKLAKRDADAEKLLANTRAQADITALEERRAAGEQVGGRILAINKRLQRELTEIDQREATKRAEIAEREMQAKEAVAVNFFKLQGREYDAAYVEIINSYNQQRRALDELAKHQAVPAAEYHRVWTEAALNVKTLNDRIAQDKRARTEEAKAAVEGIIADQKSEDQDAARTEESRIGFLRDMIVKRTEMIGGAAEAQMQRVEFERQSRRRQAQELFKDSKDLNKILLAIDEEAGAERFNVLREDAEQRARLMEGYADKMRSQIGWTSPRTVWEDAMVAGARMGIGTPVLAGRDLFGSRRASMMSRMGGEAFMSSISQLPTMAATPGFQPRMNQRTDPDPQLNTLHQDLMTAVTRLEVIERRLGGI